MNPSVLSVSPCFAFLPSSSKTQCLTALALTTLCGALASAQPVITSTDTTTATHSGRVILRGQGFGDRTTAGGGGTLLVNGLPAHYARWSGTHISLYIPEQATPGPATISLTTESGTAAANITITPRPPADGKLLWKFKTDGPIIRHRGRVAADGTVYASDSLGFLYSIAPSGALNWVYCADCVNGTGSEGPVALGHDGTIYVGGNPLGPETNIHAVNADGTRKWLYTDIWTDCVAGPSVGPDGNVYAVMETAGAGLTCLDPATGQRLWAALPPGQRFDERGQWGADITFGPTTPGGHPNQIYVTFDMRPMQVPIPQGANSALFAFGTDGAHKWSVAVGGQSIAGGQQQGEAAVGHDGTVYECSLLPPNAWALYAHDPSNGSTKWNLYLPPGNVISEPTVANDGTVYIVRNTIHIHAVNSSGAVQWTYTDPTGSLYEAAVESPDGRMVISAGSIGDTMTFSGHIRAVTGTGQNLWSLFLPRENNTPIIPRTRAFYSPDSRRAYLGTSGREVAGEEYAYLLALDTAPPAPTSCDADFNQDGDTATDQDIESFFACLGGTCCDTCLSADFNADGDTATDQDIESFFRVLGGGNC